MIMNKKDKSIVHFSGDDFWYANPRSRFHVMNAYHKIGYKILWINPIGIRFPSIKKKNFGRKIVRKVKSLSKLLRKYKDNFYIYTPFLIPKFKEGYIFSLNKFLLKLQLRILTAILKIRNPLIFFTTPAFGYALDFINREKSIYYLTDQYVLYRELTDGNKNYLEKLDKKLFTSCDIILCSSSKIYSDMKSKREKSVYYFPHKVDYKFFQITKNHADMPEDLKNINRPVIGYYGTLTDSNDWDILEYCINNRPNYNFVFIGQKDIKLPKIEAKDNVHFLGKKEYSEIPLYGNLFDVCIMFWIRREWIKNCSPLKLKEYLAIGKPIVSTYIEELELFYKDVIYISKNKEEFLQNLDKAVKGDNMARVLKGMETVNKDSWDAVPSLIEKML